MEGPRYKRVTSLEVTVPGTIGERARRATSPLVCPMAPAMKYGELLSTPSPLELPAACSSPFSSSSQHSAVSLPSPWLHEFRGVSTTNSTPNTSLHHSVGDDEPFSWVFEFDESDDESDAGSSSPE
eukprot:CAMPEP_0175810528 /NCGR_PEP_ID=MMETSP0107_2-20121207/3371_1 /TAXON_ID=195067 ORGANISM="Goniomonas pacifica, Strain CCMP1869" /NCGR_SAMPLE_ID=MMETSP0107_2 /ASSEMBLY_ACC=CAM_ASM_000203 /LENGTH=125 /DNA_ID=CAMNT_0017122289 /DNA_START=122 /DNA_END=499 /DNA_ORIENTATION=+